MLGVVVWTHEKRKKAVIWCEDQGALAYLEGAARLAPGSNWPSAGDLVELESNNEGGLRVAQNVRLLSEGAAVALPHALRAQARLTAAEAGTGGPEPLRDAADLGQASNGRAAAVGSGVAPQPQSAAAATCA